MDTSVLCCIHCVVVVSAIFVVLIVGVDCEKDGRFVRQREHVLAEETEWGRNGFTIVFTRTAGSSADMEKATVGCHKY